MEDKRLKDAFSTMSDKELQFTKEDRHSVVEKIRKIEEGSDRQKKSFISVKKLAPVIVSLAVVGLCLFLFMPSFLPGNLTKEWSGSDIHKESNTSVASEAAVEAEEISTTLITVKSKDMDNRSYLNLLLTYSKDKKRMKVVSLPSSTYTQISKNNDGTILYDKLLYAYHFGGAENVKAAVSKLINLPIDYYAVIDLETISTLIDSMDGINYDLQEDIRVRAISQVAFEFKKGTNSLNGEQLVSLMMAATEGNSLDEENLVNLMNAAMNKIENEIPQTQLKERFAQIEANVSLNLLLENPIEISSIKSVSLSDGMKADHIPLSSTEGKHIYRFEEDYLNAISEELTTFN